MQRYVSSFMLLLATFLSAARAQNAQQLYFAQTAQGAADGTSCSNAYAYNDPTYGISAAQTAAWLPGNTINLCGTITVPAGSGIVVNGSGTSAAPITIFWQPDAILQAPYFSNGIDLDGKSYITIDGGTNGILQNTANGSALAYHIMDAGIFFANSGANNITIENLTIANIYVHNPPIPLATTTATTANCSGPCGFSAGAIVQIEKTSSPACNAKVTIASATGASFTYAPIPGCTSATGGAAADETVNAPQSQCISLRGSDITIANNVMHDAGWCLRQLVQSGNANVSIYNNRIYNIDHGWIVGTAGSGTTVGPFSFYSNQVGPFSNWNDSSTLNRYHHDGVHCYSVPTAGHFTALNIYNNFFDSGTNTASGFTGQIFIEGANHSAPCSDNTSPINIFNNVFLGMTRIQNGYVVVGTGALSMFNNTCVDNNPADVISGGGSCYHLVGSTGPATINFQNNVATNTHNLIEISTAVSSTTIDYNIYANGGPAAFSYTSTWPPARFSAWKSAVKGDAHSTYFASAALTSTGTPSPNSPIRSAAKNLTPLCATLPALCFTTTAGNTVKPVARAATGPWDAGAYPAP